MCRAYIFRCLAVTSGSVVWDAPSMNRTEDAKNDSNKKVAFIEKHVSKSWWPGSMSEHPVEVLYAETMMPPFARVS